MKALVIGAGRMGGFHRRVLRDLGLDVTTVDPDPLAGADYLTVPAERFPVVCIAVPIAHLAEQAAAWAGHPGWLLIEKPGAATAAQAAELELTMAVGQRVGVGYVERFNPQVRRLQGHLSDGPLTRAVFRRWNSRSSPDVDLDLRSHDVDLRRFLRIDCPTAFDAAADRSELRREVFGHFGEALGETEPWDLHVDLTAHDTSPLHAQWHAFLAEHGGHASLDDAVQTLATLERWKTPACV